jgi:hypothetical protein
MGDGFELHRMGRPGSHVYAVCGGGRVVACLEWRQPAADRRLTGWYLTRVHALAGERLFVDVALEQLAADTERDALEWADDADSAATLSVPLALGAARLLLQTTVVARDGGAVTAGPAC